MATISRQSNSARRRPTNLHSVGYPDTAMEQLPAKRHGGVPQNGAGRGTKEKTHTREHAWDTGIFLTTILLLAIGLIALFSASYSVGYYRFSGDSLHFIKRQGIFACGGIGLMVFVSKLPYHAYGRFSKLIMAVSIILLILVAIPGIGTYNNGARRWLFGFQPSELAKITVIFCFSRWIVKNPAKIRSFRGLIHPYGTLLVVYVILLALEPHTSAMLIICAIGVCVLVAGGMRMWYFGPILVAGAGVLTAFYFMFSHVRVRFSVWLDPFSDMANNGYQGSMSQIAIGSGGLFGLGLGQGRQKHLYLPEPQNDFIFSSWCEEMGLIGALLVIALFAYLIFRGFRVARAAPDKFGCLVATGITAKLGIQTLMNLFVVTGIIPVTGAALPFFSYGGTALVIQLAEMGVLLNISRFTRIEARDEE